MLTKLEAENVREGQNKRVRTASTDAGAEVVYKHSNDHISVKARGRSIMQIGAWSVNG